MKNINSSFRTKQILSSLIVCLVSISTYAQTFKGSDISPMVNHFKKQVVTLNKSVTTYNWVSHGLGDFWDTERPQNDPELLKMAKISAGVFWSNFGSEAGKDNMYGSGLYTAVDPVVTVGFGGSNWRLTQVQFPIGTRILDLANDETIDMSDPALANAAQEVEKKFDCPPYIGADKYFVNGGFDINPKCRELIKEVFNNILQIDAFAYVYSQTHFKVCGKDMYNGSRAFVVTRPDWIRSEYVHYYTKNSRLNEEERLRIQTLFLLSEQNFNQSSLFDFIAQYLNEHQESEIISSKTVCEDDTCIITVQFCDVKNICDHVPLPAIPRPGGPTITETEAKSNEILWKDLIGKPKFTTISNWLIDNKFGCSGELPYQIK